MKPRDLSRVLSAVGLILLAVLMGVGVFRAFSRGANDFNVFFEAWQLVLSGRGAEIYRVSPDRFLYGPGFAWLLAPFGFFSKSISLALWCFLKIALLIFLLAKLSEKTRLPIGITAWGAVLIARPLLIDIEYGQVNLFILGACVWGLIGHFEPRFDFSWDFCRWFLLAFAAVAKLFPLPLLLVPWMVVRGVSPYKLKVEKLAILLAVMITLLIPVFSQGWAGTWNLLMDWSDAILARGLPLESHNQSFTALLYHYLSGTPTHVLSEGNTPLLLGLPWLSEVQIGLLSFSWTLITLGVTLGWIVSGSNHSPTKWIAIVIGFLIVPSHLIWKPYFVMSLPLAVLILQRIVRQRIVRLRGVRQRIVRQKEFRRREIGFRQGGCCWSSLAFLFLFGMINLTGFDFVGHNWAAHFEAASLLLIVHLLMIGISSFR